MIIYTVFQKHYNMHLNDYTIRPKNRNAINTKHIDTRSGNRNGLY